MSAIMINAAFCMPLKEGGPVEPLRDPAINSLDEETQKKEKSLWDLEIRGGYGL